MLAKIHGGHGNDRVQMIRCRDHDRVDVLLRLEHLAIVGVSLHARQILREDLFERVDAMRAVFSRGRIGDLG